MDKILLWLCLLCSVLFGDFVYSYDTVTGEIELREVTETFVRETDHIVSLTFSDENSDEQIVETTSEHPFWVISEQKWVAAKELKAGDSFLGANGEIVTLQQSCRTEYEDGVTVYNFEVEGNHNYFVIAEGEFGQS